MAVREETRGPIGKAAWVFAGMMLFVLLTACANVAHLLLSRALETRDELTMRTALGSSRGRLLQQLTTEAMLLTLTGVAAGVMVAVHTTQIVATAAPPLLASQQYTLLDWLVVPLAALPAATTSLVFGLLPVLISRGAHILALMGSHPAMIVQKWGGHFSFS